jgi:hypothetical protein
MEQRQWRRLVVILAFGGALLAPSLATAQGQLHAQSAAAAGAAPANAVRPTRFEQAPVIDGRLDEAVWTGAARLDGFRQVQPGDNLDPSQQTRVLIGYDRRALYLAFRADDTSGRVRATLARRDAIADDDVIGVYLDTFHDRRRAYYVFFNPYGIQADGIYTEGRPEPDLTVDLVIDSKGTVDAGGYTVEAAIPFASLRYRSGESPVWGLHVQRFIRRDRNEQISWMPLSRDRSSLLDQAGELGEFTDVGEGRPLEIIPTSIATQTGTATTAGFAEGKVDPEPGVTVNLGVTATMNAAFTVNPDFAQVEADQLVLTVNQRFPIFYDEKRPFFLEGIDAIQTPINIFHTRTIVAPDYAVKLTGKHGRTTVGALFAADGAAKTAIRIKRDVGRESTIGAAVTSVIDGGEGAGLNSGISGNGAISGIGGTPSQVVSADARLRLSDKTVLSAQLAGTLADIPFRDARPGGTRQRYGAGVGYHARLERRSRHTLTSVTAAGLSPDYRSDLGFTRRVNINSLSLQTTYNSEPRPQARLISWSATNITFAQWDWQGRANFVYVYPQAQLNFRRQTYVRAFAFRDYERLFEGEFGVQRAPGRAGAFAGDSERSTSWEGYVLQAGSAPGEALAFSASLSQSWDVFDYDFGAGPKFPRVSPAALADADAPLDPGPAGSRSVGGDVTWRPVDALRTSVEASRNTLVRDDTGLTAYDATLVSWRTTWQFTRFVFVRLRTDWDSSSATMRGQYLFGWTPSPGTAIYAGYNDVATIDGFDPASGAAIHGFRRTGRTVFVKLSYLLRTVI